ncbi:DUF2505 domain-containing protein [Acidipropionibacterium timonense]|uniref:DUF2505 domain-containing protein n=1 Tax=Acidipropionibacterium timonense TaxID=2161818 RepID=UPI001032237B|nr:DUF2505 domain-containing protein [Acidipropionibacterium timonense]
MDINSSAQFAATPDRVAQMMSDPAWWQDVYRRIGATTSNPTTRDGVLSLDADLPAPAQVTKFVGNTLRARQELRWGPAAEDGSRDGTLTITPAGMPAKAVGKAHLAPGGSGTSVTYTGSFTVSIPLVGKKLEAAAGPHITRAFDVQQEAGDAWLTTH